MGHYVGARYVPKFANPLEWAENTAYEAMTVVSYNNNSYTSKIPVPSTIGNPADNSTYWALTGNYNAQVEDYRQSTLRVQESLNEEILNRKTAIKNLKYYVTPEEYGAVGDNVTDDSSAFISALNSGFPVIASNKTYKLNAPITVNDILIGNNTVLNFVDCPTNTPFITLKNSICGITLYANGIFENTIPEESHTRGTGVLVSVNNALININIFSCHRGITFGSHCYNLRFYSCSIFSNYIGVYATTDGIEDSGESINFICCTFSSQYLAIQNHLFNLNLIGCSIDYNKQTLVSGNTNGGINETCTTFSQCFFENISNTIYNSTYQFNGENDTNLMIVFFNECFIGFSSNKWFGKLGRAFLNECIISGTQLTTPFDYLSEDNNKKMIFEHNCVHKSDMDAHYRPLSKFENKIDTRYTIFTSNQQDGTCTVSNNKITLTNTKQYAGAYSWSEPIPVENASAITFVFKVKGSVSGKSAGQIEFLDYDKHKISAEDSVFEITTDLMTKGITVSIPVNCRFVRLKINSNSAALNNTVEYSDLGAFLIY